MNYDKQIREILQGGLTLISDIKPSDWTEQNMIMQKPFPGQFSYKKTPYTREIIDCLAPDHPARIVAVMKGAQIGFSAGVIYPGVGWIIKNNPGNTLVMVGNPDLIEKSMEKLDTMIDATGIRPLIFNQSLRKRKTKTGDTNFKKEFPNGYVSVGSANNHKAIRQIDIQYGFIDDFESIKGESKESGDTGKLLEQRFAAYADTMKLFFISTPEIKEKSNILPAYLLGDQRKYEIPCQRCHKHIELIWDIQLANKEKAGITWRMDGSRVVPGSVQYICQLCGEAFDDKRKHYWLNDGVWRPTAVASKPSYQSYQISSLYAPIGMYDWEHYVHNYVEANPEGQPRIEKKYKAHMNLCLGLPHEQPSEAIEANKLRKNCREYEIGTIPEKLSRADGNGDIVLLTCACDINGKLEDARLDYEVVAWSETGSTYSICHGSIGTFIPHQTQAEKDADDRVRWSYQLHEANSVWPEYTKVLEQLFEKDTGGKMKILVSGIDTGNLELQVYNYIESATRLHIVGLKGDKDHKHIAYADDKKWFRKGVSRQNLYLLRGNVIKDDLAELTKLRWREGKGDPQPAGFMNFPQPSGTQYSDKEYFNHFESEHRVLEEDKSFIWKKKSGTSQNHLWDCRYYNMALRDILVFKIGIEYKEKNFTWTDLVAKIKAGRR